MNLNKLESKTTDVLQNLYLTNTYNALLEGYHIGFDVVSK